MQSGPTRGGEAGGDNDPGAHEGAQQRAHGLQRTHRNDTEKSACEDRRPFFSFFGDHIKIFRKRWHFTLKTFFLFWRSHQNP